MPLSSWSRHWIAVSAFCLAASLSLGGTAAAQPVLDLQPVASGFSSPVGLVNAGDGSKRLFFVEQAGIIRVFHGTQILPTPFLDIASKVLSGGGAGCWGLPSIQLTPPTVFSTSSTPASRPAK